MCAWFSTRRSRSGASPLTPPIPLVLYSRPGCHLCGVMKAQLAEADLPRAWELAEVNIEDDPDLLARFGESIPVLEIAGRVAFKGRLEPRDLERKFERRATEWLARNRSEHAGGAG